MSTYPHSKQCFQLLHLNNTIVFSLLDQMYLILKYRMELKIRKKEGNVSFNDTLNTFYLQLYDVRHMVEDDSPREET